MAGQERKKGRSPESWDAATKDAAKQMTRPGTYRIVSMQVEVRVNSPGIVHEYVVEIE